MTGRTDIAPPPAIDRARLGKVLALLASPNDGEALAATRMVVKLLAAHDMRPEQLVDGLPNHDPFGLATLVYPAPATPRSRAWSPFDRSAEEVAEDLARSLRRKPGSAKPTPGPKSFRDIGPGEARERLRQMLTTPMLPKPKAFITEILERLREPHKNGLSAGEVRRPEFDVAPGARGRRRLFRSGGIVSDRLDPALVDQLARLTDEQRRQLTVAARAERRRRIQGALNRVRQSQLSDRSWRSAARVIEAAVQNDHTGINPGVRDAIRAQLVNDLGSMSDIGGAEQIRKLFC